MIQWKKAEGNIPDGEVLAVSDSGRVLIGFLHQDDRGWHCGAPVGDHNEYLHNIRWYVEISEFLSTIPKIQP